jgi:hypothetical protein
MAKWPLNNQFQIKTSFTLKRIIVLEGRRYLKVLSWQNRKPVTVFISTPPHPINLMVLDGKEVSLLDR